MRFPLMPRILIGVAFAIIGSVLVSVYCLTGRMYWSSDTFHFEPVGDSGIEFHSSGSMFYMHRHHVSELSNRSHDSFGRMIFFCRYANMTIVDVVCYEKPLFWENDEQIICLTYVRTADNVRQGPRDYRIVVVDKVGHRMHISESAKMDNSFLDSVKKVEFDGEYVDYVDRKGISTSYATKKKYDCSALPWSIGYWLRDMLERPSQRMSSPSLKWIDDKTGYEWSYVISNFCAKIVKEGPIPCAVSPRPVGDVEVPSSLGGYNVTGIGEYAFVGCCELKRLKIPASVIRIGEESPWAVFGGCDNMVAFEVDPANAVYSSFDGCLYDSGQNVLIRCPEGKKSVHIPEGVSHIAPSAFWNCSRLNTITIPSSVVEIGASAFSMTALQEIHYLGNAPTCTDGPSIYSLASESTVSYVKRKTHGWEADNEKGLPLKWQGRAIRYEDEGDE